MGYRRDNSTAHDVGHLSKVKDWLGDTRKYLTRIPSLENTVLEYCLCSKNDDVAGVPDKTINMHRLASQSITEVS